MKQLKDYTFDDEEIRDNMMHRGLDIEHFSRS